MDKLPTNVNNIPSDHGKEPGNKSDENQKVGKFGEHSVQKTEYTSNLTKQLGANDTHTAQPQSRPKSKPLNERSVTDATQQSAEKIKKSSRAWKFLRKITPAFITKRIPDHSKGQSTKSLKETKIDPERTASLSRAESINMTYKSTFERRDNLQNIIKLLSNPSCFDNPEKDVVLYCGNDFVKIDAKDGKERGQQIEKAFALIKHIPIDGAINHLKEIKKQIRATKKEKQTFKKEEKLAHRERTKTLSKEKKARKKELEEHTKESISTEKQTKKNLITNLSKEIKTYKKQLDELKIEKRIANITFGSHMKHLEREIATQVQRSYKEGRNNAYRDDKTSSARSEFITLLNSNFYEAKNERNTRIDAIDKKVEEIETELEKLKAQRSAVRESDLIINDNQEKKEELEQNLDTLKNDIAEEYRIHRTATNMINSPKKSKK